VPDIACDFECGGKFGETVTVGPGDLKRPEKVEKARASRELFGSHGFSNPPDESSMPILAVGNRSSPFPPNDSV
jgi:hypothetical protein